MYIMTKETAKVETPKKVGKKKKQTFAVATAHSGKGESGDE